MNPQKLAGQCAKLKCCLNFEIDAYSEAQKKLPGKDMVLQTKDADYYLFKSDILARMVTYSTDKSIPANLVTIPASRAFEIISLNRQGIKVDSLDGDSGKKGSKPTYVDLVEQESLTRFDNSKKRKKNRNKDNHNQQNRDRQQAEGNAPKEGGQKKKNNNGNGQGQQERKDKNRNNNRPNQHNGKGKNGEGKNNGNRHNNPNGAQQSGPAPKPAAEN